MYFLNLLSQGFLIFFFVLHQVFDIVIQRFVELAPVHTSLDCLLDHLGCLYKFHGLLVYSYHLQLNQMPYISFNVNFFSLCLSDSTRAVIGLTARSI